MRAENYPSRKNAPRRIQVFAPHCREPVSAPPQNRQFLLIHRLFEGARVNL